MCASFKFIKSLNDYFSIILDEMGRRIDDLERNISDLINQAGAEDQHPR